MSYLAPNRPTSLHSCLVDERRPDLKENAAKSRSKGHRLSRILPVDTIQRVPANSSSSLEKLSSSSLYQNDSSDGSKDSITDLLGALYHLQSPPAAHVAPPLKEIAVYRSKYFLDSNETLLKEEKSSESLSSLNSLFRISSVHHPRYSNMEQQLQETLNVADKAQEQEDELDNEHHDVKAIMESSSSNTDDSDDTDSYEELISAIYNLKRHSVPNSPLPMPRARSRRNQVSIEFNNKAVAVSPASAARGYKNHQPLLPKRMELHVAYQCLELMRLKNLEVELGGRIGEQRECTQCLRTRLAQNRSYSQEQSLNKKMGVRERGEQLTRKFTKRLFGVFQKCTHRRKIESKIIRKCWICSSPTCVQHNRYHPDLHKAPTKQDAVLCLECSTLLNPDLITSHFTKHLLDLYDVILLILHYWAHNHDMEDIARYLVRLEQADSRKGEDQEGAAVVLAANRILVLYTVENSILDVMAKFRTNDPKEQELSSILVVKARERETVTEKLVSSTRAQKAISLRRIQGELDDQALPTTERLAQTFEK